MQNLYRCLRCKQVFVVGDFVCEGDPKCPHCGSILCVLTNNLEDK